MIDPVKALLEACEPDEMRALNAFIENAPCACHPQVQCIRCTALENFRALSRAASVLREREGGEEPAWAKGMVRNASPADWQPYRRALAEALPAFETLPNDDRQLPWDFAVAVITTYLRQNISKCQRCEKELRMWEGYRCADCHILYCRNCIRPHFLGQDHPPPAPIGEDQSDLVKRVVAVMQDFRYRRLQNAVVDGVTAELRADLTREAEASAILEAAHISRTSGSAGREMPTHKVRICQSDEEVCPFLLGQPCACPTKEAP